MSTPTMDEVLEPSFLVELTDLPIEEVRRRRDVAEEVETGLSYLRRLLQGRQDIVNAELQRRAAGEVAGDLSDLIGRLPEILGDHVHAPGFGRLTTLLAPGEMDVELQTRLNAIVSPIRLADLPHATEDELAAVTAALHSFEREVSTNRRSLHVVLDRLKEEIVRRYRTGEANVDDILSQ